MRGKCVYKTLAFFPVRLLLQKRRTLSKVRMGGKANPRVVVRQVQLEAYSCRVASCFVEWPCLGNVERRSSDCLFYLRELAF